MNAASTGEPRQSGLAKGELGALEVVVAGLASMAPLGSLLFVVAAIAGVSGESLPLVFVLATLGVLCTGNSLARFSRVWPSAGSFVTFISRAISPSLGLATAIATMIGYVIGFAAVYYYLGGYIATEVFHSHSELLPYLCTFGFALVVTIPAVRGLKISVGFSLIMYAAEIALLLAFSIAVLVQGGKHGISLHPFAFPSGGFQPVGLGFALAVGAFIGFEAPVPLAEETRNPRRNVPLSVLATILIGGVTYIVASWAFVLAFDGAAGIARDPSPLNTAAQQFIPIVATLATAAFLTSFFGSFSVVNSETARVIYNSAREGLFPRLLTRVSPKHRTPATATVAFVSACLLVGLVIRLATDFATMVTMTATLGTLLIIVMYVLVNLSLVVLWVRERMRGVTRNALLDVLVPIAGAGILGIPLYYDLKPGQPHPLDKLPWWFGGVLALAVLYVTYVRLRRPQLVEHAGSIIMGEQTSGSPLALDVGGDVSPVPAAERAG